MAYGDSLGRAARFNSTRSGGVQDVVNRGEDAEKELYGGPGPQTPALPQDMQMIQGVTDDIYKQYSAAKDFAQTMWHNYRIDVTKPDTRNDLSIKAHDYYLQIMSQIQYAGDALKQSNSLLGKDRDAVREGRGVIVQDPSQNVYGLNTPEDSRFVNTQLDPRAGQSNNAYAKSYDTQSAANSANTEVDQNRNDATDLYNQLGQPNRAAVVGGQFQGATHDEPQFRPQSNSGLNNDQARNILDQITNYQIGILNNDDGVIGSIKQNFPNIVDIRPVNTANKKGAYITRKNGSDTVTSFIDFSNGDPTQGKEALFYMLQTANPSKYKVDVNEFTPYLQQSTLNGLTQSHNQAGYDEASHIFKSLKTRFATPLEIDGKKITLTTEDKEKMIDHMDKLAIAGKLKMPDGTSILEVKWTKNVLSPNVLEVHLDNKDEDVLELDPEKPEDQKQFEQLLEYNGGNIIDPKLWEKSRSPYINSGVMNPNKGTNIDVNTKAQAKSIVDMFEKSKK